jgi:hypothetical protein
MQRQCRSIACNIYAALIHIQLFCKHLIQMQHSDAALTSFRITAVPGLKKSLKAQVINRILRRNQFMILSGIFLKDKVSITKYKCSS